MINRTAHHPGPAPSPRDGHTPHRTPRVPLAVLVILAWASSLMAQTTFTPRVIDDLLANPDIGWETFHVAADRDKALPAWLPSSVYYVRYKWREVEPAHADYRFEAIGQRIEAAQAAGQTLAFRVMNHSTNPAAPYHPDWLAEAGGRVVRTNYDDRRDLPIPDLDDPRTLEIHLELIRQLGLAYDGDPRISHVDLGSVGWWGEWHMSGSKAGMPKPETRRAIVDAYLAAFKTTPLVMLIGGRDDLAYAARQGAGWRADCLGHLGAASEWSHMLKGYPAWFTDAQLHDTWKRAPVAYESCWDMRRWVEKGWSLRYIFDYALATHASVINNKSAPLPDGPGVRAEIERFVRRLGYRIVLREVRVTRADAGGAIEIDSTWQNVGSAPIYKPASVEWQLRPTPGAGDAGAVRLRSGLDVKRLMPGEVEAFTPEFLKEPPNLPDGPAVKVTDQSAAAIAAGEYELRVCLWYGQDKDRPKPVRLAIDGREDDGWYTLGKVTLPGN